MLVRYIVLLMLRFTTPYCIYRHWIDDCVYTVHSGTMRQLVQQSQTNIKCILCVIVLSIVVECTSVYVLCQLINKSLFVYLVVRLLFHSLCSDFQSVPLFNCFVLFPFLLDLRIWYKHQIHIQSHKHIDRRRSTRHTTTMTTTLWESIWNFRWFFILFLRLSFSLFCIAVASHRFQRIISVQWIAFAVLFIHFFILCLFVCSLAWYLLKFFLS